MSRDPRWAPRDSARKRKASGSRDPRINPQRGDRITVGGETREVLDFANARVTYSWPGKTATRWLPILAWYAWSYEGDVETPASGARDEVAA